VRRTARLQCSRRIAGSGAFAYCFWAAWAALNRRDGQAPAATVEARAGAVTVYRRHNNPAFGPVGDSLDDPEPPRGVSARAAHS
jgi:hypothetical protein